MRGFGMIVSDASKGFEHMTVKAWLTDKEVARIAKRVGKEKTLHSVVGITTKKGVLR